MDPVVLLKPRSDEDPSGENLEYDSVFIEMQLAAQPGEESQIGSTIISAQDPDFSAMKKTAMAVLERSHDLRAAVCLAEALLHAEGLTGFAKVTTYIRGCLEDYWDTCHPQLDADDDDDATMRVNAVRDLCGQPDGLAGASRVYRAVRRAALTQSRAFGSFSMRDIEVAEGHMPAPADMETVPDKATVSAAFQDTDKDFLGQRLEAVRGAAADVRAISAVFDQKLPGEGPDLDPLIKLLDQIARFMTQYGDLGEAPVAGDDAQEAAMPGDAAPAQVAAQSSGSQATSAPGVIASRQDVSMALDRIIEYYARNEPSSPLPLLIERARGLVNADFMTIINDIAPDALDQVRRLSGKD